MARGRRASSGINSSEDIQRELEQLKQRQSELRGLLRKSRSGGTEVRKLEAKLEKQFAAAKWTVGQIRAVRMWNSEFGMRNVSSEWGFMGR